MSTLTADPTATTRAATSPSTAEVNTTFAGILRGEWIKLLSLRSTWWALTCTAALMTLASVAYAMSLNTMAADPVMAPSMQQMHGAEIVASGFPFGMLVIAVLGALSITGEYATGMIRSTFAAVPTRLPVLAAKALALVVLAAAVALVSMTLSYLVTMAQLSQYDLVPALDDPGTWRVLGGAVYCLTAASLFSLGLGMLLRSTAATITVALTVLLLLPGTLSFITLDWVQTIVSYLPLPASSTLLTTGTTDVPGANLSTYTSLVVVAAYAVIPLVTAAVALRRRDA
ncbi:MAG: ABC transporter permease subunit [Ornithinimicrobium sp.]|uniref:ABC transporter permease subunit n=1 Tax=Ornithinimicrobium sp. TaxID=1977084 RepID=UPI003D9B2B29